jgi:FkbM family methyltransferase
MGELFRYCRVTEWPRLGIFFLLNALRKPAEIELSLRGHRWLASTTRHSGLHFFNEVVIHGSYGVIREDLRALSKPVVVDGGANCGAFALWVLSVQPEATVISFEPGGAFANLERNRELYVKENGDHWQVDSAALSSTSGEGYFSEFADSSMGHIVADESGTQEAAAKISFRTIDELGLNPDVLKIDVEGHEVEVLNGSRRALATAKLVVVEYHSRELREQCMEILAGHGFSIQEERELLIGRRS